MRLVRVTDPAGSVGVELHPRLTVLTGASGSVRASLAATVAAIPRGAASPLEGSLDVHGILMDLDESTLGLLELSTDVDVVLRAGDLPGAEPLPSDEPAPSDEHPERHDPEVLAARDSLAAAQGRHDELRAAAEGLAADLGEVESQAAAAEAALERARQEVDSFALAGLKVARDELASLERELRAPQVIDHGPERREIEMRLDELISNADTLRREVRRLEEIDTTAVEEALAEVRSQPEVETEPHAGALELAASLRELDEQLSVLDGRLAAARQQITELTDRRDNAHAELVASERALRAPELDPSVVEELERVHDEIFELDGRESRIGANRARRRLIELRAAEASLLAKLGFDTWASYVMGVTSAEAEAERIHRHEVAKATYEFAEDELARAVSQPSDEPADLAAAAAKREDLVRRAVEILGADAASDDALAARLEAHRVPVERHDQGAGERAERLRGALASTGIDLPSRTLSETELAELAEGWLATMSALGPRLVELRNDYRTSENEIDELAAKLEALPEQEVIEQDVPDDHPELLAARAKVAEGEERLGRHRGAVASVADLERRLEELGARRAHLTGRVAETAAGTDEATQQIAAATDALHGAEASAERRAAEAAEAAAAESRAAALAARGAITVENVEWYVLARLAAQRSLSFVGSVPLLIDDAFVDWPVSDLGDVLTRIERMSEVIQILYLTDDTEIVDWARHLGNDRARVVGV